MQRVLRAVPALGVVVALLVGVSVAFADAAPVTYSWDTSASGWTGTGVSWDGTAADCHNSTGSPSGGCLEIGVNDTASSPAISVNPGSTVTITLWDKALAIPVVTANGTSVALTGCGSGAWSCDTGTYTVPASGVTTVVVAVGIGSGANPIDDVSVSASGGTGGGGGGGGSVSFPTLDLTQVGSNMSNFFAYLAPLLYVVGGIGLGGLIVSKARHLF